MRHIWALSHALRSRRLQHSLRRLDTAVAPDRELRSGYRGTERSAQGSGGSVMGSRQPLIMAGSLSASTISLRTEVLALSFAQSCCSGGRGSGEGVGAAPVGLLT